MSSVIVLFDAQEAYIGADSYCIDSMTLELKYDDKNKIVEGSNLLVAVTGRTSFIKDGKTIEIEDWVNPTLNDIFDIAHQCSLQLRGKEHTNLMVLYKGTDRIHYLDIHIEALSVITKEWDYPDVIIGGVGHCINFGKNHIKSYKDIPDLIRFDKKIEEAGGRRAVGGKIKMYKISMEKGIERLPDEM